MQFRVVTLNLEQDHKRWRDRLPLISAETAGLRPDVIALNEVCVPLQTARLLRDSATAATGIPYKLVQQTRVNGLSKVESEALLTQFAIVETGNLDYQAHDIVALVARVVIEERPVDFYVTHLYRSRGDDSLRLFQVQQLLQWIDGRADGIPAVVCGDFNATLDASSAGLMATRFRPTQTGPTAFTPLGRSERRGLTSLLAADGPLHRLHLDFRRHRDPRQRGLFQSPEPGRSVTVAVRPRRCLGRPADMRKRLPNFAWGYGVTR
jgi:endonuclease/exonuclease/phosphatase family metal-dependent hydrolase